MVWNPLGTELNAPIDEAFGPFEFPFEFEFKVLVLRDGGKEVVVFLAIFQRACRQGTLLNSPNRFGVPFPAFEGLAIEKRFCILGNQGHRPGRRGQQDYGPGDRTQGVGNQTQDSIAVVWVSRVDHAQ